jgi:hypothetical protein
MENILSIEQLGGPATVSHYELVQNYPNPFNPSTTIVFALPKASDISLRIYDITGKLVQVLAEGRQEAGRYEVDFDASDLSSGIYLYSLQAGDYREVKRMILMK